MYGQTTTRGWLEVVDIDPAGKTVDELMESTQWDDLEGETLATTHEERAPDEDPQAGDDAGAEIAPPSGDLGGGSKWYMQGRLKQGMKLERQAWPSWGGPRPAEPHDSRGDRRAR